MKFLVLFGITLVWSYVNSTCTTPLGRRSECVTFYECSPLVEAFNQRPLRSSVIEFLRQSQCGFESNTGKPQVCCGPVPRSIEEPVAPNRPRPSTPINNAVDPVNREDSYVTPRDQCGVDTTGDRIYGGQFTDLEEFPWMALLGYEPENKGPLTYQCGGVLFNHRYILTAAHCVIGEIERVVGKLKSARLGEYDIQQNPDCVNGKCADPIQEIAVHSTHPHSGFSDGNRNRKDDIALVRLRQRATYNSYVQPICLANKNTVLGSGFTVFVAGWGQTLEGTSSPVKLKLKLSIYPKQDCDVKFRSLKAELTEKQICAGGVHLKDTCKGDSGGSLMKNNAGKWESVAVVSFGYDCGRDGWPGVYTSVASYRDWIEDTLRSTNV